MQIGGGMALTNLVDKVSSGMLAAIIVVLTDCFVASVVFPIWFAVVGGATIGLQERAGCEGGMVDTIIRLKPDGTPDLGFYTILFDLLNTMPVHRVVRIVLMVLTVVLVAIRRDRC